MLRETAQDLQKQTEGIAEEAADQGTNVADREEEHVLSEKTDIQKAVQETETKAGLQFVR